jgi:CheY-like chemotaxis protein
VRRIVSLALEQAGYRVLSAADGLAALEVAGAELGRIDLLLTDLVMPRLGGRELAQRLAALRPGLRILFMTGYAEGDPVAGAREALLLRKPFKTVELLEAVRGALDRPSLTPGR